MRRRFSKRVAPVLLAMSMVINSTGVNVLAATGTASDPIPGKESSEAHETASKLTYDKIPEEAIEIIADTGTPSDTTGSPSNAKRISADIMPISDTPIGRYGNPAKTAEQLAEALGGAGYATADGNTVKLEQSMNFNDDLFIGSGEAITLDLGAYDLKLGNENEILLWSDGDGSYADLTITGTGTISNNGIYPTIEIYAGGTLVIDGVTVENKYSEGLMSGNAVVGGAIGTDANSCHNGTEVNIEVRSGVVKGTQGINFSCTGTGTVTVSGGEVVGTLGQGIMVNDTYTVKGDGDDIGQEETGEGVGVIVEGEGTVRSIAKEGAAINAHGSSTVAINGGTVEATGALGIGINVTDDVVCTITDGKVSGTEMGVGTYATQGTGNASEIYIEGGEVSGRYGAVAYEGGTVVVSEGTVKGEAAAVAGNGSDTSEDTTIIIEGGKLEGGIAGIYHPQKGTLEITGGTITGEAGVVVRAGQVSISDEAVIEATGTGTVTIGDASVGGERIQVPAAAVVADQNDSYASDEMSVSISGGTIKAAEGASAVALTTGGKEDSEIDHEKFDITGGSFTNPGTNFTKYVDDNYIAANKGGETAVGKDLETVVEALGVTAGDTLTVEKAPEGYSASIADADITIDNQSGSDITVNNHEIQSGTEFTTSEEDFVAKINEAGYTSLKDAVAHAQAGDTITLLTDITLEETVDITKAITLDLGTHEITVNKSGVSGAGIRGIGIAYTNVTMKNGTITSTVATKDDTLVLVTDGSLTTENMHFKTNNGYAINLYEFDALHKAQPATVTLSADSTIENEEGEGITAYGAMSHHTINVEGTITVKGTHPAICGSYENLGGTDITIGDTAVINGSILQMSPGNVEIAGHVTCEKGSAVIVTNGSVTIKDTANITSKFQATEAWQPSADGHVYDDGSALFIEGADSVTIEGGVLDSYHAAAVSGHNTESTDMEIKGGTFKNVQGQKSVSIDSEKQFISGGTFSSDVKKYVAEDSMELQLKKKNSVAKYYVGPEAEEALAGAEVGDEVVFEHMGESTSVEVPNGVHVQNETGADITVNNETLQNGHSETVVTNPAELSWTVTDEVTNHWDKFDEGFSDSTKVWIADILGIHAGPEAEIKYQIAITNAVDHLASEPFEVKVTLPEGAFSNIKAQHPSSGNNDDLVVDLQSNTITWKNVTVAKSTDKETTTVLTFTATVKEHPTVDKFDISYTVNGQSDEYSDGPYLAYGAVYDPNGGQIGFDENYGFYNAEETNLGGFTLENGVVKASIEQMKSKGNWNTPEKQSGWEHVVLAGWSYQKTAFQTTEKPEDLITDEFEFSGNIKLYAVWAADQNDNEIPDFNETADFTKLQEAIQKANDLVEDDYKDLTAVKSAVADAQNLMSEKPHIATEQEIQAAITAIEEAIEAAKLDFSALQNAKDAADGKQRVETDYTTSTWSAYASALQNAKEMLADHSKANHSQDTIDGIVTELTGAETALKKRADFTALDEAIKEAEQKTNGKSEDDFDGNWSAFQDAYQAAKALADQYPAEKRADTSEDVNSTLTSAAESLKSATAGITEKEPDMAALEQEIQKAEALSEDDYVDFSAVESALSKANGLKGKPGVSAKEVKDAIDALVKATQGLKKLDFTNLEKAVETAGDGKDASAYTTDSFNAYDTALKEAKVMVQDHSKANHSQGTIDALAEKLNAASAGLKERADFTALETAIRDAEAKVAGKTEDDFTDTYQAFKDALDAAKKFMSDHPADTRANMAKDDYEAEIGNLSSALAKATLALTEKDPEELSLTALNAAAAEAKAKADTENPNDYTKSSWDAFTAALKAVEDLLAEDNLTVNDQAKVNQTAAALRGAMDALEERADFTSLDNVLRVAKEKTAGKTEADYESGWNVYAAALEKAEQFLKAHPEAERSEMKASEFQAEIEQLADEVIRATSDLVEKAPEKEPEKDPEIPEKPNFEALNKAVADAEAKKESDYTSASWKALEEALKNAKAILAESGLTKDDQARVDAAKDALTKAIAGLAEKNTEYTWGSVGSGSGSSNSSTSQLADAWTYDAGRDKWTYGKKRYRNQWVYLFNPYATQGQEQYDWFYFDANGEMVTGWFTDADGLTYYLNEFSDGTRGRMVTGWNWIADASGKKKCYYFSNISDGTRGHLLKGSATPDGYTVDAAGAWVENGKAVEQ